MIVVDTCIITHLFNETEFTNQARKVLAVDSDWQVPTTWREEYANVLAKIYRKVKATPESILDAFHSTCQALTNREHKVDTEEALECALHYQISVYDAHFVQLAENLNTLLLTEDIEVLKKCPKLSISMKEFLAQG